MPQNDQENNLPMNTQQRRQNEVNPDIDYVVRDEPEEPVLSIEERLMQIAMADDLQGGEDDEDEQRFRRRANQDDLQIEGAAHQELAQDRRARLGWQAAQPGERPVTNNRNHRQIEGRAPRTNVEIQGRRGNDVAVRGGQQVANPMPDIRLDWIGIYGLPGYMGQHGNANMRRMMNAMGGQDFMGQQIRNLGRSIFRAIPCYAEMERRCRGENLDPLGEVNVIANIDGGGPHDANQLNGMARWIRENGKIQDAARMEMPTIMRGYAPEIILATNEDSSFLLVKESRRNGAPVDATYIYTWAGGDRFYNNDNANALGALGVRQGGEQPAQRIGQEHRVNDGLGLANQQPERIHEERRETARAPQQRAMTPDFSVDNPIKFLKNNGFVVRATENGPGFVKEEDGMIVTITGHDDVISIASEYNVVISDTDGNELHSDVIYDMGELDDCIDECLRGNSPGMK